MLDTLGHKHYVGYIHGLSVHSDPSVLTHNEIKQYYKIIYLKSGTFYFTLNGKDFVLTGAYSLCLNEKDDIVFSQAPADSIQIVLFRPEVINTRFDFYLINNPSGIVSVSEFQDIHYLRPFCYDTKLSNKLLALSGFDSQTIESKINEIRHLTQMQDTEFWPCRSRTCLFEILFCVNREAQVNESGPLMQFEGCPKLVLDVVYYLQSCYSEKISIEKLAGEFCTNRTTLITSFKNHTGRSVNQYLMQLRLMMASTLLRDTELTIDEIRERTGFCDTSYFCKAFKRHTRYSPGEYRHINAHQ